jgi:enolase-phosphatase E1
MTIKAILLDIEGTTTPIDFVHKTLFPFAKERIADFVNANFADLADEIVQLASENSSDPEYGAALDPASPASVTRYLEYMIDQDRKSTPLKSIQGKIWRGGYENGELKSQVFADVPKAMERWQAARKTVSIYSSGSVLAQQLMFRYTDHGDLTPSILSYFDTTTGPKREPESYRSIVNELGLRFADILFVSDIVAELDAAKTAGCETALCIRDRSEYDPDSIHRIVQNFDALGNGSF